jgi:spermidine/putrescine transport system ATP-binding protein
MTLKKKKIDSTSPDVELKNVIKAFPTRGGGQVVAVENVSLEIYAGEFFALLGPSGCGKTTTLRMIAGFEDTTSGEILIRGRAVQDVPPFHRPVNTVFQDYALFPHMTVLQNVMFGLEMEGVPKSQARARALEALETVRLDQASDRKPRQLSGGQQQRVALARAIVKKPAVLLLDEPLGALDLKLRKALQYELAELQHELGMTFIYVTHDQEEAMTMADRIAVMNLGRVLQVGTPEEIYESPTTQFVADFIGETNFVRGELTSKDDKFGCVRLDPMVEFKAFVADPETPINRQVTVAIRPEKINLFQVEGQYKYDDGTTEPAAQHKALLLKDPDIVMLQGEITYTNYIGTDTRYTVKISQDQSVVARIQNFGLRSDTTYKVGQQVNVFWDAENSRILTE